VMSDVDVMRFDEQEYSSTSFSGLELTEADLSGRSFWDCSFSDCDLSYASLKDASLEGCVFKDCKLANTALDGAKLMNCSFDGCKLVGLRFFTCSAMSFEIHLKDCRLELCNFSDLHMKRSSIVDSSVGECYFQNTFLVEANFSGSRFDGTLFHACDLQRANFLLASGYAIDPTTNKVRKAKFSLPDAVNLLSGFGVDIR